MKQFAKFQDVALLFMRLVVGAVFLYVGSYSKLMFFSGPAPEGMPGGMILLMKFLCIVEFIGAVAIILGWLTRWAAAGLAIIMVGAVGFVKFLMHGTWFTGQAGTGADYVILILAGCLILMTFGAGKWSVDAKMKR
jgi:putative oxidoreductase